MVNVVAGSSVRKSSTPSTPPLEILGRGMAKCPHCAGPVPTVNTNLRLKSEVKREGGTSKEYGWSCLRCDKVVN